MAVAAAVAVAVAVGSCAVAAAWLRLLIGESGRASEPNAPLPPVGIFDLDAVNTGDFQSPKLGSSSSDARPVVWDEDAKITIVKMECEYIFDQ